MIERKQSQRKALAEPQISRPEIMLPVKKSPHGTVFTELMTEEDEWDENDIPDYFTQGKVPPLIADKVTYDKIIEAIRKGIAPNVAAQQVGVSSQTFRSYLERGRNGINKLYYHFWKDVQKAYAEGEVAILTSLSNHEVLDWRASAWRLERQFPDRYALKSIERKEVNVSGQIDHNIKEDLATKVLDDVAARELARALIGK